MKFIKFFNQIGKNDAEIAGGKGASLGEMTSIFAKASMDKLGYNPIPEGFVVTSNAFNYFLEKEGLIAEVESELGKINFEDPNSVEKTLERLRGLIERVEMPIEIINEVNESYQELHHKNIKTFKHGNKNTDFSSAKVDANDNSFFVAVRSSATAEDSSTASWAGELESYLYTSGDRLMNNIKKCWSSLFTPRALFYRHEKGLIKDHVAVAVVVQKMVDSHVSGITFTVHPVSKDPNQMIIEAGWGLGEAIVGGMITPDDYIVSKFSISNLQFSNKSQIQNSKINMKNYKLTAISYKLEITDIIVNEQEKMIVAKKDGGIKEVKVPVSKQDKQKLSKDQILELAQICQKIEDHYGCPQDIEWALEKLKTKNEKLKTENHKFYIVQSRPITTL